MKGALRGVKASFISQGTYLDPMFEHFWVSVLGKFERFRDISTPYPFFIHFEFSKKIKGALREVKAPFISQDTYLYLDTFLNILGFRFGKKKIWDIPFQFSVS